MIFTPNSAKRNYALCCQRGIGRKMTQKFETRKLAFVASDNPEAEAARQALDTRYHGVDAADADVIIALGGDGLMLQTLHASMKDGTPIFGMNCGSVGFLMNRYEEDNLLERLEQAKLSLLHPLKMTATSADGQTHEALAINEVSLLRESAQAAKLKISIDDRVRMEELICDGVLVSTPAGSTAYNLSAHGPILPIEAALLALTPISAFRPRRWRGAILPEVAKVSISMLENEKRPVSAVADHAEFRNIVKVDIQQDRRHQLFMMFDADHSLDERILTEQFSQ
jgi:NAD+ kinase